MGDVYRARDERLGRTVAIKVLRAALNADREQWARFLREAQAASALQSSNIATIYDIGEQDGADRHCELAVRGFKDRVGMGVNDGSTTYYIASLHGLRGDADAAVKHLAKAVELLPALARVRAGIDPDFDPVREEAAFKELMAEAPTTTA